MAPNKLPLVSWLPPSEGATTLEVRDIGHLGILAGMWDEFGFTDALNQAIGVDEQMAVPPGVMLKGLVLNVFSGRDPLYRLRHFFSERVPVDVLLGPGVDADHFNDTSIGRHLDRLHVAGGARAFDAIAMCAIVHEHLEVNRLLRVDTTSRLVFGEFDHPERPDVISVTRGHSKDHRPDLKQVIFGMVTDDDGVPVLGRALDGNTEDKAWFGKVLREIRPRLRVARNQQLHLVGDAALINKPNLDVAAVEGITLTGRLPRTVAACNDVVAAALANPDAWVDIGAVTQGPHAARYRAQHVLREVLGHRVQLGVYSGQGSVKRARESAVRRAKRELTAARKQAKELARQPFEHAGDALVALTEGKKRLAGSLLRVDGAVVVTQKKAPGARGRPKKGAAQLMVDEHRARLDVAADDAAIDALARKNGCFVVLHSGPEAVSAKDILHIYKGQANVEKRFPFLKDPAWVESFFVKTSEHVEALSYVLMMALLLWTLWERRVRRNLEAEAGATLREPTGVEHRRPTAMACVHIMDGVRLVRAAQGGETTPWRLPKPLTSEQLRLIKLSEARTAERPARPGGAAESGWAGAAPP